MKSGAVEGWKWILILILKVNINGIREQLKNMIIIKMSGGTEFIACEMSMICA